MTFKKNDYFELILFFGNIKSSSFKASTFLLLSVGKHYSNLLSGHLLILFLLYLEHFIEYLLPLREEWSVLLELEVCADLLVLGDCVCGTLLQALASGALVGGAALALVVGGLCLLLFLCVLLG